jgi:hypothetical protein
MLRKVNHIPASLPAGERPVLLVIIDTEEEFDWNGPFDRASTGTASIAGQPVMHARVFDKFGIVPTYVCDWPVATTPASVRVLRDLMEAGRCEIGTHLHPWVSPPHAEQVNRFNSYAGNLPRELEYEKLSMLTAAIGENFGRAPATFKAGRYGLGPHTAESIAALGYRIDASVVPYSSFTDDGGPDFSAYDEDPYWFKAGQRSLLELPVTTGYAGWLRGVGPQLYGLAQQPWARSARLGGILARSRALERIRLSPEVASGDEMRRLTTSLRAGGCNVFSLTYHSPSMVPGHTPYVRDAAGLERFIATVHDYCAWFRDEIGGQFLSLGALYDKLERSRA